MFFSPNNIIFFERFLLYSILFISFSQIHDFFFSLHKVFNCLSCSLFKISETLVLCTIYKKNMAEHMHWNGALSLYYFLNGEELCGQRSMSSIVTLKNVMMKLIGFNRLNQVIHMCLLCRHSGSGCISSIFI